MCDTLLCVGNAFFCPAVGYLCGMGLSDSAGIRGSRDLGNSLDEGGKLGRVHMLAGGFLPVERGIFQRGRPREG